MDRANIESMGVHFKNGPFEGQQWEAWSLLLTSGLLYIPHCWSLKGLLLKHTPTGSVLACPIFHSLLDLCLARFPPNVPCNQHVCFFPTTSAPTWTRFNHPEEGGSLFLWNIATHIYRTA
jgi:hypothetical protein